MSLGPKIIRLIEVVSNFEKASKVYPVGNVCLSLGNHAVTSVGMGEGEGR